MEGCIEHNRTARGYWQVMRNRRRYYVHRLICAITHNLPYAGDWETRHLCGNAGCINPAHLAPGTRQENCDDIKVHGTSNRGERNGHSRLRAEVVSAIKAAPGSHAEIARIFKVSRSHVTRIKQGKSWGHVA